jgi:predicted ATPase
MTAGPDRPVRVFVSSDIRELAKERSRLRQAIADIGFTPVMFEPGVRPHPPRELYRAYLAQSDVFIGVYWQEYGWVAPTMEISGVEDEWRTAGALPRLVYVKEPAPHRHPRLSTLLSAIAGDNRITTFDSADDLAIKVASDLKRATGVEPGGEDRVTAEGPMPAALPAVPSRLIGREDDLETLQEMIRRPEIRLLTLTGAGGTGKSRLGLELAHRVAGSFEDGARFVSLAEISNATEVAGKIGRDLALADSGRQSITDTIAEYLADKEALLVLDNFEQVLDAAPLVAKLLAAAPRLKVIATSRAPLRITGENDYQVSTLAHPRGDPSETGTELDYPAVELFVERAKEANAALRLDSGQIEAIAAISRNLDGLPLAIELAAARTRYVDPQTLSAHMSKTLDLLSRGARDRPARQQTMRATIDWSVALLEERARRLFRRLAVLNGDSTLETIEAVANWEGDLGTSLLDELESLVDLGLIQVNPRWAEPRFSMLRVVQEYAAEQLAASGEGLEASKRHASHFLAMAEEAEPYLWQADRTPWLDHLEANLGNLRQAFDFFVESGDAAGMWRLAAAVGPYITLRGPLGDTIRLLTAVGITPAAVVPDGVDPHKVGAALRDAGIVHAMIGDFAGATPYLNRAIELLADDPLGAARARAYLGIAGISMGDPATMPHLAGAHEIGRELNDLYVTAVSSTFMAEVSMAFGDMEGARQYVLAAESLCREAGDDWLLGLTLLERGNLAIVADNMDEAVPAAEECYRMLTQERSTLAGWPMVGLGYCHLRLGDLDRASKEFDEGIELGRRAGDKTIVLAGLMGLAGCVARQGNGELAARLLGASDGIRLAIGYQLWSATLIMFNLVEAAVREAGPEEEIDRFRREGEALSYEQALALAAG